MIKTMTSNHPVVPDINEPEEAKTVAPDLLGHPTPRGAGTSKWSRRGIALLLGLTIVLVFGAGAGAFGYARLHSSEAAATNRVSQSAAATASSQASSYETVSTSLKLTYGGTYQIQPLGIALRVPTVLRTQITSTSCVNGAQGGPAIGNSIIEQCLRLSFADRLGSGSSDDSAGYLSLWDAYDWLKRDEYPNQGLYQFDLVTVAEKQKAWQTLTTLTPTTDLKSALSSLPSLAVDAGYVGGPQDITYVESADGTLKGAAFIATVAQDPEYDPHVWFEMGGTVGGQPLLVTGSVRASDPASNQIQTLQTKYAFQYTSAEQNQVEQLIEQAQSQYQKGSAPPQSKQALSEVLQILKSVKLTSQ